MYPIRGFALSRRAGQRYLLVSTQNARGDTLVCEVGVSEAQLHEIKALVGMFLDEDSHELGLVFDGSQAVDTME